MQKFEIENHIPVYSWMSMKEPEEWEVVEHAKKVSMLPWAYHHVAIMADGHRGIGPSIGSVVALKNAVSPAACGVDIGCGMAAVKYNLNADDLPDDISWLRSGLEQAIPVGFNSHKSVHALAIGEGRYLWDSFQDLDSQVWELRDKAMNQCGSLGGGNHFIEICLDSNNELWLMLHSGSRNIGKELADKHIAVAKNLVHNESLEDKNFAVFLRNTPEFQAYVHDLRWAQNYAWVNRSVMLQLAHQVITKFFHKKEVAQVGTPILCHHNYVSYEEHYGEGVWVTRKGAISARAGELGIIPGSMGAKSFIVEGLGNPESFHSASHGAGRRMSRGKAKKQFTLADLKQQTAGVECRKDSGVLDEIPGAYKDIQEVMENQSDLVRVVAELKQILCVKG